MAGMLQDISTLAPHNDHSEGTGPGRRRDVSQPRHDFQASKDVTLGIGDGLSLLLGWRMVKDGEGFKIQACNEFPIQDHVWYLIVFNLVIQ